MHFKDVVDINRYILMLEEAVRVTSSGLILTGRFFLTRFELSRDPSNILSAAWHFSEAARSSPGPIFSRFRATRGYISSAHLEENTRALLESHTRPPLSTCFRSWHGLTPPPPLLERQRVLLDVADVA